MVSGLNRNILVALKPFLITDGSVSVTYALKNILKNCLLPTRNPVTEVKLLTSEFQVFFKYKKKNIIRLCLVTCTARKFYEYHVSSNELDVVVKATTIEHEELPNERTKWGLKPQPSNSIFSQTRL